MARVHVVTLNCGNVRVELAMFREWLLLSEHRHDLVMRYSPGAGVVRYADGRLEPYRDSLKTSTRPTPANRNKIALEFLADAEADYLLMIDNDQCPQFNPLDFVERDLDVLSWPSPTCRINSENPVPWHPCEPKPGGGIVEAEVITGGCMLIARRVLEHPEMRVPSSYRYNNDGLLELGEDYSFAIKARKAGFKVWVDLEHHLLHWKTAEMWKMWEWANTFSD